MLCLCKIAVQGHIHRGMGPVPAIVGAVVAVQGVIARILQILGGDFTFSHVPAQLCEFLTGDCAHLEIDDLGGHGVTQHDGVVLAALPLNGLHHLRSEAVAVFKAAAVFVSAVVVVLQGKLVHQVALVDRMDLHTVHTDVLAELGGFGIALHIVLDFLFGYGPGG